MIEFNLRKVTKKAYVNLPKLRSCCSHYTQPMYNRQESSLTARLPLNQTCLAIRACSCASDDTCISPGAPKLKIILFEAIGMLHSERTAQHLLAGINAAPPRRQQVGTTRTSDQLSISCRLQHESALPSRLHGNRYITRLTRW